MSCGGCSCDERAHLAEVAGYRCGREQERADIIAWLLDNRVTSWVVEDIRDEAHVRPRKKHPPKSPF